MARSQPAILGPGVALILVAREKTRPARPGPAREKPGGPAAR
nr:unnamed protein product [Digitaria exilis]